MFGFVTINPKAMSQEQYARYLQAYCGQCHALGTRLGQHTRLALSHDMTFMAQLHMSLYEPEETMHESACLARPLKKRTWSENRYLDYAGDMTVALMYHKLKDDVTDDGSILASVGMKALQNAYNTVVNSWPRQCKAIEVGLERISAIEQKLNADLPEHEADTDAAANVFGAILGEIFVVDSSDYWAPELNLFGAQLGRFIYMMDAAVDLPKDLKHGSYNPFAGRDLSEDDIESLLMLYMNSVTEVFERLPLEQDIELLRNVLYSGVWGEYNRAKKRTDEAEIETSEELPEFATNNENEEFYLCENDDITELRKAQVHE